MGEYTTTVKIGGLPIKFGPINLGFSLPAIVGIVITIEDVSVDVLVDIKEEVSVETYRCGKT